MRLYTFGNFMLSPIQQSIQAAHVVAELFVNYQAASFDAGHGKMMACGSWTDGYVQLYDWATNHKTIICFSAGNNAGLIDTYSTIAELGVTLSLPYAKFHEDEQSLGGIMTCCGIIVPAKIYEYAAELRSDRDNFTPYLTSQERELAMMLNQYQFAR